MKNKKFINEIENLKVQVDNLKKLNSEILEKQFKADVDSIFKILEKHGDIDYSTEHYLNFVSNGLAGNKYTFILSRR